MSYNLIIIILIIIVGILFMSEKIFDYFINYKLFNNLIPIDKNININTLPDVNKLNASIVEFTLNSNNEILYGYVIAKKNIKKKINFICAFGTNGNVFSNLPIIHRLLQFGNVVLFDYNGSGKSTGRSNEININNNIKAIWDFCLDKLKIKEKNIVLFGESIGCNCVCNLLYNLIKNKKTLPHGLILQNCFSSLDDFINAGCVSILVEHKFPINKYLKLISGLIPILVIQNCNDENFENIIKIIKNKLITLFKIDNDYITYPTELYKFIYDFINSDNIKYCIV